MLRQHETRDPLRRRALAGRAAIFALTTVAAFALIGSAQAQECVGGYKMVKGEIPVACGDSALTAPLPSEPLYTGSIGGAAGGNGDEIPTTESSEHMNGAKCYGGYAYRPTANESYITMPMRC